MSLSPWLKLRITQNQTSSLHWVVARVLAIYERLQKPALQVHLRSELGVYGDSMVIDSKLTAAASRGVQNHTQLTRQLGSDVLLLYSTLDLVHVPPKIIAAAWDSLGLEQSEQYLVGLCWSLQGSRQMHYRHAMPASKDFHEGIGNRGAVKHLIFQSIIHPRDG